MPALVGLRRSLTRRLGRPVGQSGSGPTLWALYPSLVAAESAARDLESALDDGLLSGPGDGPPAIIATTIVG
jgi:hypothetical protein